MKYRETKRILCLVIVLVQLVAPVCALGVEFGMKVDSEVEAQFGSEGRMSFQFWVTEPFLDSVSSNIKVSGVKIVNSSFKNCSGECDNKKLSIKADQKQGFVSGTIYFRLNEGLTEEPYIQLNNIIITHSDGDKSNAESRTCHIRVKEPHVHEYVIDESTRIEPTCTKPGEYTEICSCGAKNIVEIEKAPHNFEVIEEKAPSCTENGYKKEKCTFCGLKKDEEVLLALDHDYLPTNNATEATCEDEGIIEYVCDECGATKTEKIEALGHDMPTEGKTTKEVTCTEDGEITYACQRYGCTYTKSKIIKANGHHDYGEEKTLEATCTLPNRRVKTCSVCGDENITTHGKANGHKWSEWQLNKNYNCNDGGTKLRHCVICKEEETDDVEPKGHDEMASLFTVLTPTCETEGYSMKKCFTCGAYIGEKFIVEATGHLWSEWTAPENASCELGYTESRICETCEKPENRKIEAGEHQFGNGYDIVESTCIAEGSISRKCKICGFIKKETQPLRNHHRYVLTIETKEATCTKEGEITKICDDCGFKLKESTAKKQHDWLEPVYLNRASCKENGKYYLECAVCHKKVEYKEPALGHITGKWNRIREASCEETEINSTICQRCNEIIYKEKPAMGHLYEDWTQIVKPSCTENGLESCVCKRCDNVIDRAIKAPGHTFSIRRDIREPNCGQEGLFECECEICGFTQEFRRAIVGEHRFSDWEISVAPTCISEGEAQRICAQCSKLETKLLGLSKHAFSNWKVEYGSTCAEQGQSTRVCEHCAFVENKLLPIRENRHDYSQWEEIITPTCKEKGEKSRTCASCGFEDVKEIPAEKHRFTRWKTSVNATCADKGEYMRICEKCQSVETKLIPESENKHDYGEWEVEKEAICGVEGIKKRICNYCEFVEEKVIDALSHRYGAWSKIKYEDCTKGGVQTRVCKNCGEEQNRKTEAREHHFSKWETIKAASCVGDGSRKRACKRCGYEQMEIVGGRGHKPGRFITVQKAKPYQPGVQQRICKNCNQVVDKRSYSLSKEAMAVVFSPLGIPLNELLPDRTESWFMLVPFDVSHPSEMNYPLVADNKYIIGDLSLKITENEIIPSADYYTDKTEDVNVILHFYSSLDELTPRRIKYRYKGLELEEHISLNKYKNKKVLFMYLRIEGVFDEREKQNKLFDITDYEDEILEMYKLIDNM